jgi:hypothetical protein
MRVLGQILLVRFSLFVDVPMCVVRVRSQKNTPEPNSNEIPCHIREGLYQIDIVPVQQKRFVQVTNQESKIPALDEGSRTAVVVATNIAFIRLAYIFVFLYKVQLSDTIIVSSIVIPNNHNHNNNNNNNNVS